jgi:hypothetical protein
LNDRQVQLGVQRQSDNNNNCVETFNVLRTIRHPNYDPNTQNNDISLIQVVN